MGTRSYLGLTSSEKGTHIEIFVIFFIFYLYHLYLILFRLCLVFYLNYAISFCSFYDICD